MNKSTFIYKRHILMLLLSMLILLSGCSTNNSKSAISGDVSNSTNSKLDSQSNDNSVKETSSLVTVNGKLKVHYINVGQGDSILVQQGSQNMLIDAGTNDSTETLINYLKSQNIKKLDYFILTHPHEDHIGGADAIINSLNIGTIYMSKVTTNTKTFKDVVTAMNKKGLKAKVPVVGTNFKLGDANCNILGPINTVSGDLNTYSIVLKVTFGNNKFLFTGDAQVSNEKDMINKGLDLSADVLKLGHHGSHTSTSLDFLNKVNPKYAVVSCGVKNDYGHPHKEVMQRLQAKNIKLYRTDESGTIICLSDGKNISFNTKPGDYKNGSSN
ncbi:ComEC/Rec2 family competence protein [Candidatus Clostridium radicumherbarum]|uniref:ComEC/Rec2 family competence protein n=1 Tax=Candidatus Clostridium radicumherbarum TaxID=3381662 RepID=A0ABW8TSN2_9CLOT